MAQAPPRFDLDEALANYEPPVQSPAEIPTGKSGGTIIGPPEAPAGGPAGSPAGSEFNLDDAIANYEPTDQAAQPQGGVGMDDASLDNALSNYEAPDGFKMPDFDPGGAGYDYAAAQDHGLEPDKDGKWPTTVPQTGQLLVGRQHPEYPNIELDEIIDGGQVSQDEEDGKSYSDFDPFANQMTDFSGTGMPTDKRIPTELPIPPTGKEKQRQIEKDRVKLAQEASEKNWESKIERGMQNVTYGEVDQYRKIMRGRGVKGKFSDKQIRRAIAHNNLEPLGGISASGQGGLEDPNSVLSKIGYHDFMWHVKEVANDPIKLIGFAGSGKAMLETGLAMKAFFNLQEKGDTKYEGKYHDMKLVSDWLESEEARAMHSNSVGGTVGGILAGLPGFVQEFLLTGPIYAGVRGTAKLAARRVFRKMMRSGAKKYQARLLAKGISTASVVPASLVQSIPAMFSRSLTTAFERQIEPHSEAAHAAGIESLQDVYDYDWTKVAKSDEPMWKSIGTGFLDSGIEVLSEHSGGLFTHGGKVLKKFIKKIPIRQGMSRMSVNQLKAANPNVALSAIKDFVAKTGYHGTIAEMGEEQIGEMLRAAATAFGIADLGEYEVPSPEELLAQAIAFSVPGIGIAAANFVSKKVDRSKAKAEIAKAFRDQGMSFSEAISQANKLLATYDGMSESDREKFVEGLESGEELSDSETGDVKPIKEDEDVSQAETETQVPETQETQEEADQRILATGEEVDKTVSLAARRPDETQEEADQRILATGQEVDKPEPTEEEVDKPEPTEEEVESLGAAVQPTLRARIDEVDGIIARNRWSLADGAYYLEGLLEYIRINLGDEVADAGQRYADARNALSIAKRRPEPKAEPKTETTEAETTEAETAEAPEVETTKVDLPIDKKAEREFADSDTRIEKARKEENWGELAHQAWRLKKRAERHGSRYDQARDLYNELEEKGLKIDDPIGRERIEGTVEQEVISWIPDKGVDEDLDEVLAYNYVKKTIRPVVRKDGKIVVHGQVEVGIRKRTEEELTDDLNELRQVEAKYKKAGNSIPASLAEDIATIEQALPTQPTKEGRPPTTKERGEIRKTATATVDEYVEKEHLNKLTVRELVELGEATGVSLRAEPGIKKYATKPQMIERIYQHAIFTEYGILEKKHKGVELSPEEAEKRKKVKGAIEIAATPHLIKEELIPTQSGGFPVSEAALSKMKIKELRTFAADQGIHWDSYGAGTETDKKNSLLDTILVNLRNRAEEREGPFYERAEKKVLKSPHTEMVAELRRAGVSDARVLSSLVSPHYLENILDPKSQTLSYISDIPTKIRKIIKKHLEAAPEEKPKPEEKPVEGDPKKDHRRFAGKDEPADYRKTLDKEMTNPLGSAVRVWKGNPDIIRSAIRDILLGEPSEWKGRITTTKPYEDRRMARAVLEALENAPETTSTLFRGFRGDADIKVGDTISLGTVGTSSSRSVAKKFASDERGEIAEGKAVRIYEIEPGAKAHPLSKDPLQGEAEHLVTGGFEVTGVTQRGRFKTVRLRQIDSSPSVETSFVPRIKEKPGEETEGPETVTGTTGTTGEVPGEVPGGTEVLRKETEEEKRNRERLKDKLEREVPSGIEGVRLWAWSKSKEDRDTMLRIAKKMREMKTMARYKTPTKKRAAPGPRAPLSEGKDVKVKLSSIAKALLTKSQREGYMSSGSDRQKAIAHVLVETQPDGSRWVVATDGRYIMAGSMKLEKGFKDGLYSAGAGKTAALTHVAKPEGFSPEYYPDWKAMMAQKELNPDTKAVSVAKDVDVNDTLRWLRQASVMTTKDDPGVMMVVNTDGTIGFSGMEEGAGKVDVNINEGWKEIGAYDSEKLIRILTMHATMGNMKVNIDADKLEKTEKKGEYVEILGITQMEGSSPSAAVLMPRTDKIEVEAVEPKKAPEAPVTPERMKKLGDSVVWIDESGKKRTGRVISAPPGYGRGGTISIQYYTAETKWIPQSARLTHDQVALATIENQDIKVGDEVATPNYYTEGGGTVTAINTADNTIDLLTKNTKRKMPNVALSDVVSSAPFEMPAKVEPPTKFIPKKKKKTAPKKPESSADRPAEPTSSPPAEARTDKDAWDPRTNGEELIRAEDTLPIEKHRPRKNKTGSWLGKSAIAVQMQIQFEKSLDEFFDPGGWSPHPSEGQEVSDYERSRGIKSGSFEQFYLNTVIGAANLEHGAEERDEEFPASVGAARTRSIDWLNKESENPHPENWGKAWLEYNKRVEEYAKKKATTPPPLPKPSADRPPPLPKKATTPPPLPKKPDVLDAKTAMDVLNIKRTGKPNPGGLITVVSSRGRRRPQIINKHFTIGPDRKQTKLKGVRRATLNEITGLAEQHNIPITITGVTEPGHFTKGKYTHAKGYKVDLSIDKEKLSPIIESWKQTTTRKNPSNGKKEKGYVNPDTGSIYWREADHWDVEVDTDATAAFAPAAEPAAEPAEGQEATKITGIDFPKELPTLPGTTDTPAPIEVVGYHGSRAKTESEDFDPEKMGEGDPGVLGRGVYFYLDRKPASIHKHVTKRVVRLEKPLDLKKLEDAASKRSRAEEKIEKGEQSPASMQALDIGDELRSDKPSEDRRKALHEELKIRREAAGEKVPGYSEDVGFDPKTLKSINRAQETVNLSKLAIKPGKTHPDVKYPPREAKPQIPAAESLYEKAADVYRRNMKEAEEQFKSIEETSGFLEHPRAWYVRSMSIGAVLRDFGFDGVIVRKGHAPIFPHAEIMVRDPKAIPAAEAAAEPAAEVDEAAPDPMSVAFQEKINRLMETSEDTDWDEVGIDIQENRQKEGLESEEGSEPQADLPRQLEDHSLEDLSQVANDVGLQTEVEEGDKGSIIEALKRLFKKRSENRSSKMYEGEEEDLKKEQILYGLPPGVESPGGNFASTIMAATKRLSAQARYKALRAAFGQHVAYSPQHEALEYIEVTNIRNQRTMAHELGHVVDYRMNPWLYEGDKTIRKRFGITKETHPNENLTQFEARLRLELKKVSAYIRGPWENEGQSDSHVAYRNKNKELFADFFSMYTFNREMTKRMAPEVVRLFEEALDKPSNAKVKQVLKEVLARRVRPEIVEKPGEMPMAPAFRDFTTPRLAKDPQLRAFVEGFMIKSVRKRTSEHARAFVMADRHAEGFTERELQDIGAAMEGVGNIEIEKDTIEAVRLRLSRKQEEAINRFRFQFEEERQGVNKYLREANSDAEYIKYVVDYLSHYYVTTPDNAQEFAVTFVKKFSTKSGAAKKRTFPTMKEAMDAGYIPRTQNPQTLLKMWAEENWRVAVNRGFVKMLRTRVADNGMPVILTQAQAKKLGVLGDYVKIDHHALQRAMAVKKGDKIHIYRGAAYVHPDAAPAVRMMINEVWTNRWITAVQTLAAWMKKIMLSASFFHHVALSESAVAVNTGLMNPIRGFLGFEKKTPPEMTHRRGKRLMKDTAFVQDAIQAGLQFGATSDIAVNRIAKQLGTLEAITRGVPVLGKLTKRVRQFNEAWDKALWDNYHTGLKFAAFYDMVQESIAERTAKGEQLTPEQIHRLKEWVANHINNAFGGQEWESKMWLNPKARQIVHIAMLAPDWTLSNFNIAIQSIAAQTGHEIRGVRWTDGVGTKSVKLPIPTLNIVKIPKAVRSTARKRSFRYWRNMIPAIFIGQTGLQAAIYAAFGDPEKDDKMWMWQNEWGSRTVSDITPLWRLMPWRDKDDMTRHYAWGFKQAREVVKWAYDPGESLRRKMGPIPQTASELFGLLTDEAQRSGEDFWSFHTLLKEPSKIVASRFAPFSFRKNNFAFALPKRQGMTPWKAREAMKSAFEEYANPSFLSRLMRVPRYEQHLVNLVLHLVEASNRNSPVDVTKKVFIEALTNTRALFYRRFFAAVESGNASAAKRHATSLLRLHRGIEGIAKSAEHKHLRFTEKEKEFIKIAANKADVAFRQEVQKMVRKKAG